MSQSQSQSMSSYEHSGAKCSLLRKLISTPNDWAMLVVRVVLGAVMLPHGMQKTLGSFGGHGFNGTMGFFNQILGVPKPMAFLVIMAESLGALALIFGFVGRFMAFGIVCVMLGAVQMAHAKNGFFMNWNQLVDATTGKAVGEGFEYHLLAIGMAVAVMIRGSGAASLDRAMMNCCKK